MLVEFQSQINNILIFEMTPYDHCISSIGDQFKIQMYLQWVIYIQFKLYNRSEQFDVIIEPIVIEMLWVNFWKTFG